MILVDTNIIIDFWNKPTAAARKIFSENDTAICGVIKTELLRGSKSANDFAQIQTTLADFYSYGGFNPPTLCVVTKGIKADCNHLMRTTYPDACVGVVDYLNFLDTWVKRFIQ